jgi:hypothetical protein
MKHTSTIQRTLDLVIGRRLFTTCWLSASLGISIIQMRLLAQALLVLPHALAPACQMSAWILGSLVGLRVPGAPRVWGSSYLACVLLWLIGPALVSLHLPLVSPALVSMVALAMVAVLLGASSTAWLTQQRGTSEGCEALRTISLAHPEMEWIRWVLVDAERLVRRRTWSGFKPEEILAMAHDKARRFVQNGEQLLAVVTESLVRLQETLHGETPARIFLWDVIPAGEGEKRYRPKDENSLSDYVKLHLERDLKQRGIIVLREVEIRHAAGGDPGNELISTWTPICLAQTTRE